jgi:hypothetical protein
LVKQKGKEFSIMSKKKKRKRRRRKANNTGIPTRLRRLPAPRVSPPVSPKPTPGKRPEPDNPITAEIIRLHAELNRVTRRGAFQIWFDWLETEEAWLKIVGARGELEAMAGLPAEVQQKFDELDRVYTQTTAHYPSAYRKMGETFTIIHRLLADTYPCIDLEACEKLDQPNPDILGQAFLAGVGSPRSWQQFFPGWPACLRLARELIPDPAAATAEVYEQLAQAHIRARSIGAEIETLQPGENETWAAWFEALEPYYEPLLVGPGLIFSSTMLLALASRFPAWITRNGLIRFAWPDIEVDPVLSRITSITAMLYGFNGFYAGKQQGDREAIAQIETYLETTTTVRAGQETDLSGYSPPPVAVFQQPPEQEPTPKETGPSFSDLFKTT